MSDLSPLLVLFLFVPSLATGAICAALVFAATRWTRLDQEGAKALVATCWWVSLTAVLRIGADQLMAARKADNAAPFAAILIWIVVVPPGPFIGNWITSLGEPKRHR